MNRRATPNRAPILILLAVIVVIGVLIGRLAPDSHPSSQAPRSRDVVVPAGDALSATWYCAGGTSDAGGVADETIVLGNVSVHAAAATITVTPGASSTRPSSGSPKARTQDVTVGARSTRRVKVSSILAVAEAGVMVETRGGQVVVEQLVGGSGDVSLGPCAREPSTDWTFAAGSTEKGARDWIALYNPFNDAAKVDVTSYTLDYSETPNAPQLKVDVQSSVEVDPQHETMIELSDPGALGRRDPVGVVVHATEGTVVAARRLQFEQFSFPPAPAPGAPAAPVFRGLTLGLGAPGPSGTWVFPEGPVAPGIRATIDILNPGRTVATAEVAFHLVGVAVPVILTVPLAPQRVTRVDPTNSVQGKAYSVVVRHRAGPPIVAEQLVAADVAPNVGVSTTLGESRSASEWAFIPGRIDGSTLDGVRIFNPTARTVRANLVVYSGGDLVPLGPASKFDIEPGTQWGPSLDALGVPPDALVIVVADGPVYGSRIDTTPGFTISNGVPFPDPQVAR